jgi:ABC-type sugar transport system permease subunit
MFLLQDSFSKPQERGSCLFDRTDEPAMKLRLSNSKYGFFLNVPGLLIVLLWVVFPAFLLFCTSFLRYDNVNPIVHGLGTTSTCGIPGLWISLTRLWYSVSGRRRDFFGGLILALLEQCNLGRNPPVLMTLGRCRVISGLSERMFSPDFGVISDLLKIGLVEALSIYGNQTLAMWGDHRDSWTRFPMGIILWQPF